MLNGNYLSKIAEANISALRATANQHQGNLNGAAGLAAL